MRILTLFIVSHAVSAALIALLFVAATNVGSATYFVGASLIAPIVLALACAYTTRRIRRGLMQIESAITALDATQTLRSDLDEFEHSAHKIGASAQRWETIASHNRQQTRELKSMLSLLNRRGVLGEPTSAQLRELLAGLGNTLHSHLSQVERGTSEIEQYAKAITEGSETQSHAVVKTTSFIEQLASTIDAVSHNAASTKSAIEHNRDSADSALDLVRELIEGMKRVRAESQHCEKKLRGLCDPSQQIVAMVRTISDIAARTDLLALNASIESIRAGEHGRGFAIVAEEVRKLAEQSSSATREISHLIDSIQIVTQESIREIEKERLHVDAEVARAATAVQTLQKICGSSDQSSRSVEQITVASNQQLQLAQDIVLAVEQISQMAKANRSGAENVAWTMKSLSKMTPQFTAAIDRLRNCGDGSSGGLIDEDVSRTNQGPSTQSPIAMPVNVALPTSPIATMG